MIIMVVCYDMKMRKYTIMIMKLKRPSRRSLSKRSESRYDPSKKVCPECNVINITVLYLIVINTSLNFKQVHASNSKLIHNIFLSVKISVEIWCAKHSDVITKVW